MEFTDPLEAAVVAVAHNAELGNPKTNLLALHVATRVNAVWVWSTPCLSMWGYRLVPPTLPHPAIQQTGGSL